MIALASIALLGCTWGTTNVTHDKRVVLQPDGREGIDAFIEKWEYQNYPNTNWGNYEAFAALAWTASGTPMTARSLMKFDMRFIPKGTRIKKATLSLYATSLPYLGEGHSDLGGPNDLVINRILSGWEENSVTWNTQPRITREGEVILPPSVSFDQDYTDIDITEMVQAMVDNPPANYGFMIRLMDETYYRSVIFASSDYPDSEKHPRLVIEY